MGLHTIRVPDVGEGVAEVELVAWTVAVGETVARNQVLAEVMTDKANVEIPAPVDGVIAELHGEIGEIMAVGSDLIRLQIDGDGNQTAEGEVIQAPAPTMVAPPVIAPSDRGVTLPFPQPRQRRSSAEGPPDPTPRATPNATPKATPTPASEPAAATPAATGTASSAPSVPAPGATMASSPSSVNGARRRAAPAVRRRARDLGLDLTTIAGTGPGERITHADLDRLLRSDASWSPSDASPDDALEFERPPSAATTAEDVIEPDADTEAQSEPRVVPLVGLRRQIAQRMVTATTTIPHITYVEEVDVTEVEALRSTLNDRRVDGQDRLTLLPFLIRAIVAAMADHPQMNAHVDDDAGTMTMHDAIHVGIATQTDRGLLVPVVRDANRRSLWSLAAEIGRVAGAARDRSAEVAELSGSTITITSLGALGGVVTTPVINKPEVAIVGVNKIDIRPVWDGSGFTPRRLMNLSSSFDHRVIDGFDAASFIRAVKTGLEQPALLFVSS